MYPCTQCRHVGVQREHGRVQTETDSRDSEKAQRGLTWPGEVTRPKEKRSFSYKDAHRSIFSMRELLEITCMPMIKELRCKLWHTRPTEKRQLTPKMVPKYTGIWQNTNHITPGEAMYRQGCNYHNYTEWKMYVKREDEKEADQEVSTWFVLDP